MRIREPHPGRRELINARGTDPSFGIIGRDIPVSHIIRENVNDVGQRGWQSPDRIRLRMGFKDGQP